MFTRLSFGTVWTAKLRHSSTSDASADAASTKLAHVPTQITPHKTWIHRAAVLSDIERYASFTDFESSSHTHADCGRRARPASRTSADVCSRAGIYGTVTFTEVRLPC